MYRPRGSNFASLSRCVRTRCARASEVQRAPELPLSWFSLEWPFGRSGQFLGMASWCSKSASSAPLAHLTWTYSGVRFLFGDFLDASTNIWQESSCQAELIGWRNTVEVVLFEISNSMKPYPSVFYAYTSTWRPVIGLLEPNKSRRGFQPYADARYARVL